jgi:hypothetical protein
MIAVGCLSLVVLPLAGLALGGVIAGSKGAVWAACAGLMLALTICGLGSAALIKARRKR